MAVTYFALITNVGAAKLANATALGTTLKITHLAVGDGGGAVPTPDATRTALVNEVRRAPLNSLSTDPSNASQIIAEQVIPESVGGWWIREMGLYDEAGSLIAYANCAPSYKPQLAEGSGRTQTVRIVLIVSSTAAVELKIDPSVVLATRKYVDDQDNKKADKATTLGGYGITDAYTRSQADTLYNGKVSKSGDTMSGTLTLFNDTTDAPDLRWNNTVWNAYIDLYQNQFRLMADQSGPMIFPLVFDLSAKTASMFGYSVWNAANFDPATKANKSTTLGGYGITDAFTKTEVTNSLASKADKATTLGGYGIADAFTKTEVTNSLSGKADKATTLGGYGITDAYTRSEANGLYNGKLSLTGGALSGDLTLTNASATSPKIRFNNTSWNAYLDLFGSQLRLYADQSGATSYPLVWGLSDQTMYAWGNQVWTNANRPKNSASFGANGWWKDADTGRIEVWGQATLTVPNAVGSVADLAVSFATSFPVEVSNLSFAIVAGNATEVVENVVGFYNLTTGGVVISAKRVAGTQTGGETIVVHYRATGR